MARCCPSAFGDPDTTTTINGIDIDIRTGEVIAARDTIRATTAAEARAAASLSDAESAAAAEDEVPPY